MMPPDWQELMTEMIRGAAPLSGEWYTGSGSLTPEQQIGIYEEQFRLRMWDALLEEIPGLSRLLGDDVERVV